MARGRAGLRHGPEGLTARSCGGPCSLVLLLAGRRRAAADLARGAGARPARGRAHLPQDGKLKQALDNFNTIVSGFPNTDVRGRRAARDRPLPPGGREATPAKARDAFEQVTKRFPQSDGAPGAYYYLGRLTLERAATAAELDDALAQFARVQRLYPRSDWVPRRSTRRGLAHRQGRPPRRRRRTPRAASPSSTPRSDAAPAAQFQVGHALALLGESAPGHGGVPAGPQPLSRAASGRRAPWTASPRSIACTARGKPAFALDAAYAVGAGDVLKDVRGDPDDARRARCGSPRTRSKGAVPFGARRQDGRRASTGEDLQSLSPRPAAASCWWRPRAAVRVGPAGHPDLRHPRRQAGRDGAAGEDRGRGRHAGRRRCSSRTRSGSRSSASTARSSTRGRSPTPRSAQVSAHASSTAKAAS